MSPLKETEEILEDVEEEEKKMKSVYQERVWLVSEFTLGGVLNTESKLE